MLLAHSRPRSGHYSEAAAWLRDRAALHPTNFRRLSPLSDDAVLCAANVQRVGTHIDGKSGDESMTHRDLSLITSAVAALLIGISSAAIAQTVTPELIAPGAGLPGGSIGGRDQRK